MQIEPYQLILLLVGCAILSSLFGLLLGLCLAMSGLCSREEEQRDDASSNRYYAK